MPRTLAIAVSALLPAVSAAQHVTFEPAPTTVAELDATFDKRALRVLRYNACGREQELASWQAQGQQGEDVLDVVIAKIAIWNTGAPSCEETAVLERPMDPGEDGSPAALRAREARTYAYAVAQVKDFDDGVANGSNCARRDKSTPLVRGDRTYSLRFTVTRDCLKQQINSVLGRYGQDKPIGTSGAPCVHPDHVFEAVRHGDFKNALTTEGDYDVDVRQLMRAMYLARIPLVRGQGGVIDQGTIDHLFEAALPIRGPVDEGSYSIFGCGNTEAARGNPEDSTDDEGWLDQAVKDTGDVFKKAWKFLIKLWVVHIIANFATGGGASALPFVLAMEAEDAGLVPDPIEAFDVRIPETENHRLMIESSRWLTNQWTIEALRAKDPHYPGLDVLEKQQVGVREWLLHRMQEISQHDFVEYNSRAYQRYSINALVNLHDFAGRADPQLQAGARIVLDFASAKFATGSNRARRFAPFRRLEENDGYGKNDDGSDKTEPRYLYNYASGADHQVPRFLVLAGQTQLLPLGLDQGGIGELVDASTSRYRLPDPIAQLALDRTSPMLQRIHHDGFEIYASSASYLLSAGGVPTGPSGKVAFLDRAKDHGVAVPTVLMVTPGAGLDRWHVFGLRLNELFRFEGIGKGHERSPNTCVWKGIACGVNLRPPDNLERPGCLSRAVTSTETFWTMSSARCDALKEGPHFYLAARARQCPGATACQEGMDNFGVLIVADAPLAKPLPAPDPAYDQFVANASRGMPLPADDRRTNVRLPNGDVVVVELDPPRIRTTVVDQVIDESKWPLASEGPIQSSGDGLIVVTVPGHKTLTLDFRKWDAPEVKLQ